MSQKVYCATYIIMMLLTSPTLQPTTTTICLILRTDTKAPTYPLLVIKKFTHLSAADIIKTIFRFESLCFLYLLLQG